jgi:hypothetical protein
MELVTCYDNYLTLKDNVITQTTSFSKLRIRISEMYSVYSSSTQYRERIYSCQNTTYDTKPTEKYHT